MIRRIPFCTMLAVTAFAVGCSSSPETPLSPSATTSLTGGAANPDGSTLKMSAPVALSPAGGETVGSARPSFSFRNATSATNVSVGGVGYRLQLLNEDGSIAGERIVGQTDGGTSVTEADADLEFERNFAWRVRAELEGAFGPWSTAETFRTPNRPASGGAPSGGGTVGNRRSISLQEAFAIIVRVHNDLGWDLGSRSSREQRVDFLFSAVAAIHYGHPRFNPGGGDPLWCVKDAGGGRPPSDDVLVRCDSRDSWDLIGGAGANGYSFHLDYIGQLPGVQNVYPPAPGYLNLLR